jgi:hypothetical protein
MISTRILLSDSSKCHEITLKSFLMRLIFIKKELSKIYDQNENFLLHNIERRQVQAILAL